MKCNRTAYLLLCMLLTASCESPRERVTHSNTPSADKIMLQEMNKYESEKEQDILHAYVRRQGLTNMQQSATGYFYETVKKGNGATLKDGDLAQVYGHIFLLDGTPCYAYDAQHPLMVRMGTHSELKILNIALRGVKRQSHVRFVFPAYQAYGLLGDGNKIPARNAIVCDLYIH